MALDRPLNTDVTSTLEERGKTYGEFQHNASLSDQLQKVMSEHLYSNWDVLLPYQRKALQTIADEISRILTGDPKYVDNWHDIGGYAKLVENILTTGKSHPSLGSQDTQAYANCAQAYTPVEKSVDTQSQIMGKLTKEEIDFIQQCIDKGKDFRAQVKNG